MNGDKRYLKQINHAWFYRRKIPKDMQMADSRYPEVLKTLGTRDITLAKRRRTLLARADDNYWSAIRAGINASDANQAHEAAVQLLHALGLDPLRNSTKNLNELLETGGSDLINEVSKRGLDVWDRMSPERPWNQSETASEEIIKSAEYKFAMKAVSGKIKAPEHNVSGAFRYFLDEMSAEFREGKTAEADKQWVKQRQLAVNMFIDVVADKPLLKVTRHDAIRFHKHLRQRVARGEVVNNTAGKRFREVSLLWRRYAEHFGEDELRDPFRDLKFGKGMRGKSAKNKRDEFTSEQIAEMLNGNGLVALNLEARHIFLLTILTGARPSEIYNITGGQIHLDSEIPHICIESVEDGHQQHGMKNANAERQLPLIGLALEIMRMHPRGFKRYFGKGNSWSQIVNKQLTKAGFKTNPKLVAYSARHSFVSRLRNAKIGDDLRREILGHEVVGSHSDYGRGYSLEAKAEVLKLIEPNSFNAKLLS